jgi:putative ABC transport system permease protein
MTHPQDIGALQLFLGLGFILLAQGCSLLFRLGLVKDLTVGTVRTFAQLFIMGYALKYIFDCPVKLVSLAVFAVMVAAAAHIVGSRVKAGGVKFRMPVFFSMLGSYLLVAVLVTGVIVQARPWYDPVYFIPLAGMVVGNSMNSLAIALERLFSDLQTKRELVEMRLCLGATPHEASQDFVRDALKAGMIPAVNAMMGVGVVFIPGMMTGQILAGADPLTSIRYQIVVMLMLVASSALSTLLAILASRRRCFGKAQELVV